MSNIEKDFTNRVLEELSNFNDYLGSLNSQLQSCIEYADSLGKKGLLDRFNEYQEITDSQSILLAGFIKQVTGSEEINWDTLNVELAEFIGKFRLLQCDVRVLLNELKSGATDIEQIIN